jgi:ribosome biogenesis GTPase
VLPVSAESGLGVDALRDTLRGHGARSWTIRAGKSRLIGRLQAGLKLVTGSVSEKTGQGRHTTTRVDLHRTEFGALIADTPGVRDFSLWRLDARDLRDLFPNSAACSRTVISGCVHVPEPECAVKAAVDSGAIDASRYRAIARSIRSCWRLRRRHDRERRARKERNS